MAWIRAIGGSAKRNFTIPSYKVQCTHYGNNTLGYGDVTFNVADFTSVKINSYAFSGSADVHNIYFYKDGTQISVASGATIDVSNASTFRIYAEVGHGFGSSGTGTYTLSNIVFS